MENSHPFVGLVPVSVLRDGSVVGRREMYCRRSHGLIIKLAGETEYCIENRTWLLSAGEILFVGKGASYQIREVTPGYSYVINFECSTVPEDPVCKLPLPQGYDLAPEADRMYRSWQKQECYKALSCLYNLLEKSAGHREQYATGRDRQLLEPALKYLKEHLTDPELKLTELSRLAGVSDAYLRRVLKKQYGVGPAAYVIRERIRLAKALLESGERRVATVAVKVGYRDPLYFSRLFKKQVGLSPTEFWKAQAKDLF